MKTQSVFTLHDFKNLEQIRDEIILQANLLKSDLKDRFESLEKDWTTLNTRMSEFGTTTQQVSSEVSEATILLAETIRDGYQKIKSAIH